MAVAEKTLLEFLLDLLHNSDALAEFQRDPHAALDHAGLSDCSVDDIKALLPVVLEKVDAEKCAQYEDDCDDDRAWDSEPRHHHGDDHHAKPIDCDDDGRPAPHCSPVDQVVAHLNYVTNNYSYVDSHDTYNTTDNITKIWAGDDADIHVDNTTTNVGNGGTFVGHDNNAPITHGDGNVVGDDNQVSGPGSTTAFGTGSALSHVGTGDGGAISVNGPATATGAFGDGSQAAAPGGSNVHTDSHDDNSTNVDNSHQDHSDHSLTNSQNHDDSDHSVTTDDSVHDNKLLSDNDLSQTDDHTQTVDHGHIDNAAVPVF